jgi:hypothetical protein
VVATYNAKVSFVDAPESVLDVVLTVADDHVSMEAAGRSVGSWPISDLSPQLSGDSVVVSAEGERLVIDVTDPDALRVSLGVPERPTETGPGTKRRWRDRATQRTDRTQGRSASSGSTLRTSSDSEGELNTDELSGPEGQTAQPVDDPTSTSRSSDSLRSEIRNVDSELVRAQEQLRWVQELVPRRLPIPLFENESGLGVVQGVQLKERRSTGRQPWVVVDSGNVYVTDRRLVFSGAQDVVFEFGEIDKKGALQTGLLLGVSSRAEAHVLAGPGERLAVVLTAAEKIAEGLDPSLPFRDAVARLTSRRTDLEERLASAEASIGDGEASDQSHGAV